MPFHEHESAFSPEQLDVMTAAFSAATRELERSGVEVSHKEIAKRIVEHAAKGVLDIEELKRAALTGHLQSD